MKHDKTNPRTLRFMESVRKHLLLSLLILCTTSLTQSQMPTHKVVRAIESTLRSPEYTQYRYPQFAPVNNLLSFEATDREGNTHLYIEQLSTMKRTEISAVKGQTKGQPLYESSRRTLGPSYTGQLKWCPALHSGKQWFAFVASVGGNQDLYAGSVDNLNIVYRITDHSGVDDDPVWSPDGECLLYTGRHSGNADLFLIKDFAGLMLRLMKSPSNSVTAEGLDNGIWLEQVTRSAGDDIYPTWSPAGTWIVYSVLEPAKSSLIACDVKSGKSVELLEDRERVIRNPSFSPDGRRLAYYSAPGRLRDEPVGLVISSVNYAGNEITGVQKIMSPTSIPMLQDVKGRVPGGPYWSRGGSLFFLNEKKGQKHAVYEIAPDAFASGGSPTIRYVMSGDGSLPFNIIDFDFFGGNESAGPTIFSAQRGDEFGVFSDFIARPKSSKRLFVSASGFIINYANDDDPTPQPGCEIEGGWEIADRMSIVVSVGIGSVRKDLGTLVYFYPSFMYRIMRQSQFVLNARAGVGRGSMQWGSEVPHGNPWLFPVGLDAGLALGGSMWLVMKGTAVITDRDMHPGRTDIPHDRLRVDYYMQFSIGLSFRFE